MAGHQCAHKMEYPLASMYGILILPPVKFSSISFYRSFICVRLLFVCRCCFGNPIPPTPVAHQMNITRVTYDGTYDTTPACTTKSDPATEQNILECLSSQAENSTARISVYVHASEVRC